MNKIINILSIFFFVQLEYIFKYNTLIFSEQLPLQNDYFHFLQKFIEKNLIFNSV